MDTTHYIPLRLPLEDELSWSDFTELLGPAHVAVGRYDGLIKNLPNAAVLLSPLSLSEAVSSNLIEGTEATVEGVLEQEADSTLDMDPNNQEVINYRKAMLLAENKVQEIGFTLRLIRDVHRVVLSEVRGENKTPGEFRAHDVRVGKFLPPTWQTMSEPLDNFEQYLNLNDKDVLVQLAIVHAQFEIIHPFGDGNGRMGRLIMPLFLYHKGVIDRPVLYLSEYFERDRAEYVARLYAITNQGDWDGWVKYFLNAVHVQTEINITKALKIQELYAESKDIFIKHINGKHSIQILDFIFSKPIFTSTQLRQVCQLSSVTAVSKTLLKLQEQSLITEIRTKSGRIPALYKFNKLLDVVK